MIEQLEIQQRKAKDTHQERLQEGEQSFLQAGDGDAVTLPLCRFTMAFPPPPLENGGRSCFLEYILFYWNAAVTAYPVIIHDAATAFSGVCNYSVFCKSVIDNNFSVSRTGFGGNSVQRKQEKSCEMDIWKNLWMYPPEFVERVDK